MTATRKIGKSVAAYPHPPNLAQEEMQPAQRTFWIVKHGIKMSAMPAWGKTLDDAAMTSETYQDLSRGHTE
jgi:hypothetical protein